MIYQVQGWGSERKMTKSTEIDDFDVFGCHDFRRCPECSINAIPFGAEDPEVTKMSDFEVFGSKSLKSDNFDFFRI